MRKIKEDKITNLKSKISWNVSIFLCIAIIILGTVFWDYYAVWAYIDFSFLKNEKSQAAPIDSPPPQAPSPTITPEPTFTSVPIYSPTATPVPTPAPTATPIPHPGDRDGKFTQGEIIIGDTSYQSEDLSIEITKYYENDITYFVAEVYVRDMANFYGAFANGKYGSTYRDTTTQMAEANNAIFAVSGDFYNARDGGIIIRNSILYRNEKEPYREVLAVYNDGSVKSFRYKEAYTGELAEDENVVHTFVFGPILVTEGQYGREYSDKENVVRHPRTAIGMVEPFHYYFIVADGRKKGYSIGMTVVELSDIFLELGCTEAYNLDGGGTATMVFMNELVNLPQGTSKERGISDSICFIEKDSESGE